MNVRMQEKGNATGAEQLPDRESAAAMLAAEERVVETLAGGHARSSILSGIETARNPFPRFFGSGGDGFAFYHERNL